MRVHGLFGRVVISVFSFLLLCGAAGAAGFPERPIQFLLGWPVGTPNDLTDRAIAKPLSKILGQPVIVQNVPGGGGALVLGRVKTEKPDGYSIFQTGSTMFSQIPVMRPTPFDPLKDFAYLAQHYAFDSYLYCRSDSPWKTYEDLIQYAKQHPGTLRYGTTGTGSSAHVMMEYLAWKENIQWVHVPFNTGVESTTAILGGHLDFVAQTVALELEHIKTGRLRALLCLTAKRMADLPDLPTVTEKGYDFSVVSSAIWAVPAATPKDIQKILEKALLQAFTDPEVQDFIKKSNKTYGPLGSEELTRNVIEDHKKFKAFMKQLGLGIFKK